MAPVTEARARVSVVIPALDEERGIVAALERALAVDDLHEIIVVDGGSTDATVALVQRFARVGLLSAPRGRASQMNAGAQVARGDVLLFLHADVSLPRDAVARVRAALRDAAVVAGAFRTWTVADGAKPRWSRLLHLADLRSRYTRFPYGDQALFVRADVFRRLGGFAPLQLMEDLELSRRLSRIGRVLTVAACVTVSGRRFVARPLFYSLLVNLFPLLFYLGVSPKTLSALYGHVR